MSVSALVDNMSVEPVSGTAILVLVAARFTAHAATKRQEDQNLSANVRSTAYGLALKYWSGRSRTFPFPRTHDRHSKIMKENSCRSLVS